MPGPIRKTTMRFRFEDYVIDRPALELRRAGERVELAPMAVRVLTCLAERSPRMVPRQELYERLWPDGGVDRERLLNTYVRQIRSALGERAGEDRYLRTYPRRGYRFLPTVEVDDGSVRIESRRNGGRWRVAAALVLTAGVAWGPVLGGSGGPDPLAYRMGLELLADPSPAARASAEPHFREALAEHPEHAGARAGLAESLFWSGDLVGAESAARAALGRDPGEARAHLILGSSLLGARWAWADAERHLRAAVRSAPGRAESWVGLSFLLVAAGRQGEARETLDRAVRLEPAAAAVTGDLGLMYGWIGDHERALDLCRRTVAIEPRATWGHECALEAARALGDSVEMLARSDSLLRLLGGDPERVFAGTAGAEDRVRTLRLFRLERERGASAFLDAVLLARLGRPGPALDALERAAESREMGAVALGAVPAFTVLAEDPRFEALLREVRGG